MAISPRASRFGFVCFTVWLAAGSVRGGDDLLPPPVRQAEKRFLGGGEEDVRRMYFRGRGGFGAAFSPDGKFLLAASINQGLSMWDVATGKPLGQLVYRDHAGTSYSAAFTPDGKKFFSSNQGRHGSNFPVSVWDAAKRQVLRDLDEDVNDTPFGAMAVAPNGKWIALGAAAGGRNESFPLVFWDIANGDETGRIDNLLNADAARMNNGYQALAFSPDGRTLAVLLEGRILLVEFAAGKVRSELAFTSAAETRPELLQQQQPGGQGSLVFSPDGRTLAAGCSDGAIRRFDLRTGRELTPLSGHSGGVAALCWPADGKRILSYGQDGQFSAWRVEAGSWKSKAGPLTDAALESLWEVLRGDDPVDLFGSLETLSGVPAQAVPMLRKRMTPIPAAEGERVENLAADLLKPEYNVRKKAAVELRKLGAPALPVLRRMAEKGNANELVGRLMNEFTMLTPAPDQMRAVRALRVLERIGNAEARKLLEELSAGSLEAALTVQARAALERLGKAVPAKEQPAPEELWNALAEDDSGNAYRAIRALAGRAGSAPMLHVRLKDVISRDTFNDNPQRVAKLIADLDSKTFNVRDKATKALNNLNQLAVPALRKALASATDLETKRRIEKLLEEAGKSSPPPEMLRIARVLEVLEMTAAPEGRQTLEALAKDMPLKWVSEAASEALRRQREEKR